jgi:hypothetical protein
MVPVTAGDEEEDMQQQQQQRQKQQQNCRGTQTAAGSVQQQGSLGARRKRGTNVLQERQQQAQQFVEPQPLRQR